MIIFGTERRAAASILLATILASPALGQELHEERRVRVGVGAQVVPSFPGAEDVTVQPMFEFGLARGGRQFRFSAPDDSFGISLVDGAFRIGPAVNFKASRKPSDLGAPLRKVKTTIEGGAFAQYQISDSFRIRAEARKGLGGHDGWIGDVGADYIVRDGDKYVFSIGPRVTVANARYQRAYFGVTPEESLVSGLPVYRPSSGVTAVGATSGLLYQFTPRWGMFSYAKYERLIDDAGRSPVVRQLGSRDQFSGGLGLTYTFGLN
jgi:outer membrane protein